MLIHFKKYWYASVLLVFAAGVYADGDFSQNQVVPGESTAGSLRTIGEYPAEHERKGQVIRKGYSMTLLPNDHIFIYGAVSNGAEKNGSIVLDRKRRTIVGTQEAPAISWFPELHAWKVLGRPAECPQTSYLQTATLLANNRILFSGGICDASRLVNDDSPYPPAFKRQSIWNDGLQKWESAPSLIADRIYHTATSLSDGNVLIAGGVSDSYTPEVAQPVQDSVELFLDGTASHAAEMVPLQHLHFARARHTATQLGDGSVMVVGGMDKDDKAIASVEIWNPKTKTWHDGPGLNTPRFNHTSLLLSDGRLMVAGGIGQDGNPTRSVEIFNPEKQSWTDASPLLQPLRTHSAVVLSSGDVLVTGTGFNESGYTASIVMLWLKNTEQWKFAGNLTPDGLSDIRDAENYNLLANKDKSALVFGNSVIMQWLPALTKSSEYIPDSGRVGNAVAVLNDGKVLLAGGKTGSMASDLAEIYDPESNRFSLTGNMKQPRWTGMPFQASLSSVVTDDGRVVLAGGWVSDQSKTGKAIANFAEAWDPSTGEWNIIKDLHFEPLERVYLGKLADGRVLFFASNELSDEGLVTYRSFIWNPRDNKVTSKVVSATPRAKAAIAILGDGRVLIVGGSTRAFVPEYNCPEMPRRKPGNAGEEEGSECQGEAAHWASHENPTAQIWNSRTGVTSALPYPPGWHAANPQTLLLKNGNVVLVNSVMPHPMQEGIEKEEWLFDARHNTWSKLPALATNTNWPMTELIDGSIIAWAASNISPSHANILKSGAISWEPILRFPQYQATVTQLPSGKLLAFSPAEPYVSQFDEKSQAWLLQLNNYLKTENPALVELADGNVAVVGSVFGNKKTVQIWNPKNNTWVSSGAVAKGNTTGKALRLPSGAVMNIGYGDAGSYVCDIWNPDDDSWSFCGNFKPENKGSFGKFVLGSLEDGRGVFMGSSETAFVFNESSREWTPMDVEWNLKQYTYGIAVHGDKPIAQFLDPLSKQWIDASVIGGKYYSTPFEGRNPDSMLWDPKRKHWAYISFIMGNNGFWLPDGCAISGPPFKIYNPLTGKVAEYPGMNAGWMRQGSMTVLSDGTVVVAGGDSTGAKFFHRKASCTGFEALPDDSILMPGILASVKPVAEANINAETKPIKHTASYWWKIFRGWIVESRLIILAVVIPFLLYFAIKYSRDWLNKKLSNTIFTKSVSPKKGGNIISLGIRVVVYSILAMILVPIVWYSVLSKLAANNRTPSAKALPCRYIGIWSQPFHGLSNRVTLKADGQYIYEKGGRHLSEYGQPLMGRWAVDGENMIWYSSRDDVDPDVNRILEKSERSFTLLERTGDHSRFELIEAIKSDTCIP